MSVLADLYVSQDDTEAVVYDREPSKFADREQITSFTVLELSTLLSLMRGLESDVALLDEFPTILQENNGERSIFRTIDILLLSVCS